MCYLNLCSRGTTFFKHEDEETSSSLALVLTYKTSQQHIAKKYNLKILYQYNLKFKKLLV